ncbi:uncharacterized protein [Penaeus vannamei]|uniref:uncharacterized protein n=1 Tax=Penaeus vannamei TaxID=6689 RepID=UPI00387F66E0
MVWEPLTCCGISRRTAGFTIASITAIYCVIDIVFVIYFVSGGFINELMKQQCNGFRESDHSAICFAGDHDFTWGIVTSIIFRMLMAILHVICSFLLIHGIRKNIPRLMVPYMVVMSIAIGLLTLFAVAMVMLLILLDIEIAMVAAAILGGIIFIMTYFNLVVRAYYMEVDGLMKDNDRKI